MTVGVILLLDQTVVAQQRVSLNIDGPCKASLTLVISK